MVITLDVTWLFEFLVWGVLGFAFEIVCLIVFGLAWLFVSGFLGLEVSVCLVFDGLIILVLFYEFCFSF